MHIFCFVSLELNSESSWLSSISISIIYLSVLYCLCISLSLPYNSCWMEYIKYLSSCISSWSIYIGYLLYLCLLMLSGFCLESSVSIQVLYMFRGASVQCSVFRIFCVYSCYYTTCHIVPSLFVLTLKDSQKSCERINFLSPVPYVPSTVSPIYWYHFQANLICLDDNFNPS
jgi:hypothetical protein